MMVEELRPIAFVVGVVLLSFIVWRVLCWLDIKTYECWKRSIR